MPFLSYINNGDTGTTFTPNFNEIPLWNGYRYNNLTFSGTGYDINNSKTDKYVADLGSIVATTNSTLRFNRDFKIQGLDTFLPTISDTQNILQIKLQLKFKLVGASETKYAFIRNGTEAWHDIDVDFANSLTKSLKSTRSSAVKVKCTLLPSKL